MKRFWLSAQECSGCGACANACPVDAISMEFAEDGFRYPVISGACVDCDKCERTCVAVHRFSSGYEMRPDTFAVWSKSEEARFASTSGGAFTELANAVLAEGGAVFGALYGSRCDVKHGAADDAEGLKGLRQSKYVQSDIGFAFREVKQRLDEGRMVAFCGAPCQVAGLRAFLGRRADTDKLVAFDFVCRGVNSPKAYRAWLDELESAKGASVAKVWFKYKVGGWKTSPVRTRIEFDDGSDMVLDGESNLFMRGYLESNLFLRPSCANCQFKGFPRQGDITLADFWGLDSSLDDDRGASMVLVNGEKGKALFERAKEDLEVHERSFDEIFVGNVCIDTSVKRNRKSQDFMADLDAMCFSAALGKHTRVSLARKSMRKMKALAKSLLRRG
ncbi:Coenzyme F420 hydrogenase/dehydrogenase, beta subunit C-terminal domain [Arabiibacter massiliensis]|uniref:Coenzyme F420 hydrogenase/dehydrogenase, beta subunit C-terminal domain n=1 Tax=Arabiibacter massiliensis TaxID=1870985 RepID=UPI0009BA93A4|nr:Coenzyme F420 hydrogenase/dehydrogenase, beta subunit C-terminal domain [Arabiibacter massiliensis]